MANVMSQEKFDKSIQCLIDNGIEAEEAETVLQAIVYIICDEETERYSREKHKYIVSYEETLSRKFIVDAHSEIEAEDIMLGASRAGRISLDDSNYLCGSSTAHVIDVLRSDGEDDDAISWYDSLDEYLAE